MSGETAQPSMHYVYVLQVNNGEFYIGFTNDLRRRFSEHKKLYRHCMLLYYEAYRSEGTARIRELKLKHYGSAWRALKKRIGSA